MSVLLEKKGNELKKESFKNQLNTYLFQNAYLTVMWIIECFGAHSKKSKYDVKRENERCFWEMKQEKRNGISERVTVYGKLHDRDWRTNKRVV